MVDPESALNGRPLPKQVKKETLAAASYVLRGTPVSPPT
jgi:hypothetical protein